MNIEITGIGFGNKGAELMLVSVVEQLSQRYGNRAQLVALPTRGNSDGYRCVGKLGVHMKLALRYRGADWGRWVGNLLPKKLIRTYGCMAEKEIKVVLDASGLRYSEKWGVKSTLASVRDYRRIKKRGGKVILLPQAFGPFEDKAFESPIKELYDLVDHIFVRDELSMAYLYEIIGETQKMTIAPDFTCLSEGEPPKDRANYEGKICLIPNSRMMDKTSKEIALSYENFLLQVIEHCRALGHDVFILNHSDWDDDDLCARLANAWTPPLSYSGVRSANEVKGIIGCSQGVITSRYHGLASALYQGIPSLATSWNHKYEELMKDYAIDYGILDSTAEDSDTIRRLEHWLELIGDPAKKEVGRIQKQVDVQKEVSREMWAKIFKLIEC